jgi:hypothetical protein
VSYADLRQAPWEATITVLHVSMCVIHARKRWGDILPLYSGPSDYKKHRIRRSARRVEEHKSVMPSHAKTNKNSTQKASPATSTSSLGWNARPLAWETCR